MLSEHIVLLLPAAVYALSAGYAPFLQRFKELPLWYPFVDVNEAINDLVKVYFVLVLVNFESHITYFHL